MTTEKQTDYENPWIFDGTLFYLRILTVCTVSSTALLIHSLVRDTSVANTFGNYENLEVEVGELKVKATGKNTTSSSELTEDRKQFGNLVFKRDILKLHKTKGLVNFEETRQLFINNVLTEAMSDGTPAFYNSNILGRYMRKDYFNA